MNNKINIIRAIKSNNIRQQDPYYSREIGWDDRFHLGKLQYNQHKQNYYNENQDCKSIKKI
jgi:hypothetical protein